MKRAYFVAVIDVVFCLECACDEQMLDTFQLSCLTRVRYGRTCFVSMCLLFSWVLISPEKY